MLACQKQRFATGKLIFENLAQVSSKVYPAGQAKHVGVKSNKDEREQERPSTMLNQVRKRQGQSWR